jgi:hypothetical protein
MRIFLHFFLTPIISLYSKPFPYLKRKMNQAKACKTKAIPTIPLSVAQARQHQYATDFMEALDNELLTLRKMECHRHFFGDALTIPKGRLVNSRIVFDIVYNSDGTFKKFKALLVARDDQLHQLDPNNFAATVKSETFRILLAIVAERDYDYDSLDVKTAILYPTLHSDDKV